MPGQIKPQGQVTALRHGHRVLDGDGGWTTHLGP